MRFSIQKNISHVKGIAKYIRSEYSFDFEPTQSSSYDVLVGDLTISFDVDLNAKQVWGYNPNLGWIDEKLSLPTAVQGTLNLANEIDNPQRIDGSKEWKTYYDSCTGWVCIGISNKERNDLAVEFATNTIAVLNDGNLKAIWIKPLFT